MKKIRLLLVDDHPIVREGIKSALSARKNISIVGEAATGEEAIIKALKLAPDVILMDINMPGMSGLEASRRLRKSIPDAKILALTMHENQDYVPRDEPARCPRLRVQGLLSFGAPPCHRSSLLRRVLLQPAGFAGPF